MKKIRSTVTTANMYDAVENCIADLLDNMESNIVQQVASMLPEYDPDWFVDEIDYLPQHMPREITKFKQAREEYIKSLAIVLLANMD